MSIKVNLKIFLFIMAFYFTKQIQIYAVIMICAILHEMGHLVCGIILGLKPKSLHIMPLGLCIEFSSIVKDYSLDDTAKNKLETKKILVAFAGPLTNIIICIITAILFKQLPEVLALEIIYSNILIAIFNLIPIYPLDGGRIVKIILKLVKGSKKSSMYSNLISNICIVVLTMVASVGIYYYKNIAILLIIAYLWVLIIIENRRYDLKKRIYKMIENS